jgi:spore coat protein U-like protein
MGASTAANLFLGGTVTPAANQAPGSYVATIVMTVTIQ